MVDIFISYSRSNQDKVRLIADRARALGYHVWWDDELPPHKSYGDVITEKIGMAKAAIVVWSQTAVQSEWVRAEADVARNQKKLIQTSLDGATPPMPFNQIQYASLDGWTGDDDHHGWRKVKASLAELCGPPGETPDPPRTAYPMPGEPPPPPAAVRAEMRARERRTPLIFALLVVIIATAGVLFATLRPAGESATPAEPPPSEALARDYPLAAMIEDADGFTYVRNAPANSAAVVGRVLESDVFHTFEQPGDWWEIETEDGVHGFMHRSRFRLVEGAG